MWCRVADWLLVSVIGKCFRKVLDLWNFIQFSDIRKKESWVFEQVTPATSSPKVMCALRYPCLQASHSCTGGMESHWSKEALEASSQGCLFLSKHGVFNRGHRSQVEITKKESHVTHICVCFYFSTSRSLGDLSFSLIVFNVFILLLSHIFAVPTGFSLNTAFSKAQTFIW